MGEHQKIFLITPTCADAQVFFALKFGIFSRNRLLNRE